MELHDTLYALGLQTGRDVFDDPERLRGMLAQSGAPAGEIDLVVDAVRRGAYRSMLTALDSGVDPARAVQDAGAQLARERGSDPGSAAWALAVLGFAVGRVGENDVRRHRGAGPVVPPSQAPTQIGSPVQYPPANPSLQKPPAPYQPPSGPPAGPPAAPYGQQPPVYEQPQQPYGQQSYAAQSYGQQPQPYGAPQQAYGQPQQPWSPGGAPPKKSKLPILLGVGGTLVAVIVAVVLAIVLVGGNDDGDNEADRASDSTSATTEPTSEATETSEPTTEATSETTEPAEDPGRVSDEAAAGYTSALLTFSTDFGDAGNKLQTASTNDNTQGAKAAGRDLRKAVYDLDLAVRDLDLAPVQTEVNAFLKVSGQMIDKLDKIERDATTALDVNLGVVDLPITPYTDSFQTLADAIDATRA